MISAYDFTLGGLLKSCENLGSPLAVQPPNVDLQLKPYQRMSLQFMMDCETSAGGINARFWQVWQWPCGERYFYSPFLGELRLEQDMAPIVRGGQSNTNYLTWFCALYFVWC